MYNFKGIHNRDFDVVFEEILAEVEEKMFEVIVGILSFYLEKWAPPKQGNMVAHTKRLVRYVHYTCSLSVLYYIFKKKITF